MGKVTQSISMKRCLLGFLGITVIGMLLHNAYAWTRPFPLFALIAPVNESVWEHLKMAYWAVLIFGMVQWRIRRHRPVNLAPSLALGSTTLVLFIVIVFYSYTFFSGRSILWADISTFIMGAFFSRWLMCRIQRADELSGTLRMASVFYLAAVALVFILFTYAPPEMEIFTDHSASTGVH